MTTDQRMFEVEESRRVRFTCRPIAIAADLRPDWKIACLLLTLHLSSRSGKSTLRRLHVLNWAIRSAKTRAEFQHARQHHDELFRFQFRFDPSLGRAINFAAAEELVEWVGGDRIQITAKGTGFAIEILKEESLMDTEREFLEGIGKRLSESEASEMIKVRSN